MSEIALLVSLHHGPAGNQRCYAKQHERERGNKKWGWKKRQWDAGSEWVTKGDLLEEAESETEKSNYGEKNCSHCSSDLLLMRDKCGRRLQAGTCARKIHTGTLKALITVAYCCNTNQTHCSLNASAFGDYYQYRAFVMTDLQSSLTHKCLFL